MNKLILAAICCLLVLLLPTVTFAISAQWDLDPTSGDWNTAANWTPNGVPNGPADVATFGLSNTTDVSTSADIEVGAITFTSAATNPYTITAGQGWTLTISGVGITNNSGFMQTFVTAGGPFVNDRGTIRFTNSATAGSLTAFTNNGMIEFSDNATAGSATMTNIGVGAINFLGNANAGNGTFINNAGSRTEFFSGTANAANGMFINNGGIGQGGETVFAFSPVGAAANGTFVNNGGAIAGGRGGVTLFAFSGTSGGTFINNGATAAGASGGITEFFFTSAGNATITNNGAAVSGAGGGITEFSSASSAGNATIINNGAAVSGAGGGVTKFDNSTAESATLIANGGTGGAEGGTILFLSHSSGDTCRVKVFGNGSLDISDHDLSPVTVGSIEGDGNVFLGTNKLKVGSNDLSTTFSGIIEDGGQNGGVGGSLRKIGSGTLDLTGTNTYTGDTNVNGGVLQVDGSITSNTFVHSAGKLAGTGTIYGNLNNKNGGKVIPGGALGVPGVLTVVHNYTQAEFATLMIQIAGDSAGEFSVLNVLGSANLNGNLAPVLLDGFIPTIGESFTFLNYSSFTGGFSQILNPVFNHGTEQWSVVYQNTYAILTVEPHTPGVPDQGSTFLLLTLGLFGLVTYRRRLLHQWP